MPSLEFMTRGVHFWVMFAPLLVPIIAWLVSLWRKDDEKGLFKRGGTFSLYLVGGLWIFSSLIGLVMFSAVPLGNQWVLSTNPTLAEYGQKLITAGQLFAGVHGSANGAEVLATSITRRLTAPGTWLTLMVMLGLVWGQLWKSTRSEKETLPQNEVGKTSGFKSFNTNIFVLFLVLIGVGLTLFPEFFYLRDQFGKRMNTIFKFYFQAWVIWGIAAAYVTVVLWHELKGWKKVLFNILWTVVFISALIYPAVMLVNKTNGFKPSLWTLNGNAYIQTSAPDESLAMEWLKNAPMGVVAEAVGGSYRAEFARISTQTGLPTVLGWPGHEWQWRGGGSEIGNREAEIKTLYETGEWFEALSIIDKYDIRYIYIGSTELSTYLVDVKKFEPYLSPVYQNGSVTIYEVPSSLLTGTP